MARKKTVISKKAKVQGDVNALLTNPEFNGDVQFGDRYVQADAKPRETHGLYGVPELPRAFTPRPEELKTIKTGLLSGETNRVGITGKPLRLGLQGMGGIGKTTLAIALAREPDVQNQFPQGIFWISLGQQPNILSIQAELANLLETNSHMFITTSDGRNQLERLLRGRRCLLILDDVWQAEHAEPFNCMDPQVQACLLVTTRNQEVINRLDAHLNTLDVLTSEQALVLLAQWANTEVRDLPAEAGQVADKCGNLPLALAMAGAMAIQKSWRHALERLRRADFDRIEKAFPYAYPNLLRALQASLDDLDESETLVKLNARGHYLQLSIFPEDTPIPTRVLETLWMSGSDGLVDLDFEDLLAGLKSRALLQLDSEGRVHLHDLQRDFIVNIATTEKSLVERQAVLLDTYRLKTSQGLWHTLPDDGYIYQYLAWHMVEAGQSQGLSKLLLDFNWLQSKLNKTDINTLLRDYDTVFHRGSGLRGATINALRIIQDSLRLSVHVLTRDKSQLAGQLLGRLLSLEETEIVSLIEQIRTHKSDYPWLRSLVTSLKPGGDIEIFTLEGHEDTVTSVALAADGHLAVSGSRDHTLKVWDLTRPNAKPRTLEGHQGTVNAVSLTPDGRLAVSGSWDNTLKIWDLTRPNAKPRTLKEHKSPVLAVALTPDGRLAVSGSWDNTLKVWDLTHPNAKPRTLKGHKGAITAVALTPDGRLAVSSAEDNILKVWDLTRPNAKPRTLKEHEGWVNAVALTPDGRLAVFSSWSTLKVWDLTRPDAKPRALKGHKDAIMAVALTPDGRLAVSGSKDKTLKVWDLTRPNAKPRSLAGHEDAVIAVVVTPDGRLAVSGSRDSTLKVWDLTRPNAKPRRLAGHEDAIMAVALTPDGRLAVSGSKDKTIKVWDLTRLDAEPRTLEGHEREVSAVAITSDGRLAVSGSWDNTLKIWDLTRPNAKPRSRDEWVNSIYAVALTPDGRLAVSGLDNGTFKVWDLTRPNAKPRTVIGHRQAVTAVALTADGRLAVSGSADNTLKIWDLTRPHGKPWTLEDYEDTVNAVALTPDGRLAVSSSRSILKVLDLTRPDAKPRTLEGHQGIVNAVSLTPDGRLAVSGSSDHTLKVWDINSNRLLSTFTGQSRIFAVSISGDGRTIFAGGSLGEVYFFRLEGPDNAF